MAAKDTSLFVIKDDTVLKQDNHHPNGFIDILIMLFSPVFGFILSLTKSLLGLDILIDSKQNSNSSVNKNNSSSINESTVEKDIDLKNDEIIAEEEEENSSPISSPPMSVSSSTSSVLFPQRSNFISSLTDSNSNLNECSTGPESQLFSFTNKKGELEWSLMDNNNNSKSNVMNDISNLDSNYHQLSPISDSSTHSPNNNNKQQHQHQQNNNKSNDLIYGFVSLSPISSIKSTGSSHMSSGNESNTTNPTSTNNSPNVSSGNDDDMSPQNEVCFHSKFIKGFR
ncbi:unnamed protein product [[Candida] boidinii]|nr:unnamed protein product [[Candida] boidinii]